MLQKIPTNLLWLRKQHKVMIAWLSSVGGWFSLEDPPPPPQPAHYVSLVLALLNPQDPSPLRGTLGSSLRSPPEGEGNEGFPPPPDKDLESPSSTRLEALVPSRDSRARTRSPMKHNTVRYVHGWRRQWHPTPVLLPGESHGRRSLVGCSPWGR